MASAAGNSPPAPAAVNPTAWRPRLPSGWPIVGWCAAIVTGLAGLMLAWKGAGEAGMHAVIRTSAQTSFALFTAAFTASALRQLWPSHATWWLRANRRYLGVSFAVSHTLHLAAILALWRMSADFDIDAVTLIGGGLAYVFIFAMTATSFNRSATWVGPRVWRVLHTTGAYYLWVLFFISYAPRAAQSAAYVPFAALLVAALALRLVARRRTTRLAPSAH